jgi:hypothetical protein
MPGRVPGYTTPLLGCAQYRKLTAPRHGYSALPAGAVAACRRPLVAHSRGSIRHPGPVRLVSVRLVLWRPGPAAGGAHDPVCGAVAAAGSDGRVVGRFAG